MGISKALASLLLEEKKEGRCKGSILQLGRQHTFVTYAALKKLFVKHGIPLLATLKIQLSFNPLLAQRGFINDQTFFRALGFDDIQSLDYSDFEGADIIWDLNMLLSDSYADKFDCIIDGGTTEHIFDIPTALKNMHKLLKKEGYIIHASPSHNHVDHGFYMFSPTLLYEYYQANNYRIVTSYIFEYDDRLETTAWHIYKYQPGILDKLSFGGFGKKMLGIYFVVQKLAESTSDVIPQQGSYKSLWDKVSKPKLKPNIIKTFLKKVLPKRIRNELTRLQFRWTRQMPPKVAKH